MGVITMKFHLLISAFCIVMITACSSSTEPKIEIGEPIDYMTAVPNTKAQFQDGLLTGMDSSHRSIIINYLGERKVVFDDNVIIHGDLNEGLICVSNKDNGLWGYADAMGEIVIPCQFNYCSIFSDGLAYVETDGRSYFINKDNETVIEGLEEYRGCEPFREGYSRFYAKDGKIGFIDKDGNISIEPIYDSASDFRDGLASVCIGENWGVIDKSGKIVIPFEYKRRIIISEGFVIAGKADKSMVLNQLGEAVFETPYEAVTGFSEGLACVRNSEGKIGYIDTAGSIVIPFSSYTLGHEFKEGYALVGNDQENCGYIDLNGNEVTPMTYLFLSGSFNEKYALAVIDVDACKSVIIREISE